MLRRALEALILTPAVFIVLVWCYFLSPVADPSNIVQYLAIAAAMSFCAAYSVRLFIGFLHKEKK